MKLKTLYESSLFDGAEVITEDMLTESFIENTLKPQLEKIFAKKAQRAAAARQQYERAIQQYVQELNAMGINGNDVRKIAERKARGMKPENLKSKFSKQMLEMFDEMKGAGIISLTAPILTIIFIIYVSTVFSGIFILSFGPDVGMMIGAILVAPVVEEIGRWISIKNRAGGQFTILFNAVEFLSYVLQSSVMGVAMGTMALVRIAPIILHTLLTVLMRSGIQSGSRMPGTQAGVIHGLYNAANVASHAIWNSFAGIGVLAIPIAMATAKDKSVVRDTTRMIAYGYSGKQDQENIRIDIMAEEPTIIMVQKGIDATFIELYASKIAAEVIYWNKFEDVQWIYTQNKDTKMAVILADDLLSSTVVMGGGPIKRWLRKSIYIRIIRSKKAEMEA